jgi:hypothetical protein
MRGDYLFYEEKIETTLEEKQAKAARRFVHDPFTPNFCSHPRILALAKLLTAPKYFPLRPRERTAHPKSMVSLNRHTLLHFTFRGLHALEDGTLSRIFQ